MPAAELAAGVQRLVAEAIQAQGRGDLRGAGLLLSKALKKEPGDVRLHNMQALLQIRRKQPREALKTLSAAVRVAPGDAMTRANIGGLLCQMGRQLDAIPHLHAACVAAPHAPEAFNNLGYALRTLGDLEGARAAFASALVLNPSDTTVRDIFREVSGSLVESCERDGRDDDALALMDDTLRVSPDWTQLRHYRATFLLARGQLRKGWDDYRQNYPNLISLPQPDWDCRDDVDGTLLVRCEQGIGEQIMFASVLPELRARCRKVLVEVDYRLIPLLERAYPDMEFVGWFDPPASRLLRADIISQLQMSRSFASFRPDKASIAANPARLVADSVLVAEARRRLAEPGKPLIGISWASPRSPIKDRKTVPLSFWRNMLALPARFLPLQYDEALPDGMPDSVIRTAGLDPTDDLAGLGVAIAACDVVVTISNFVAHMAGALGVPTLVLIGQNPLWHWFRDSETCPWYPSATLLRRRPDEPDWAPLMERATERVAARHLDLTR